MRRMHLLLIAPCLSVTIAVAQPQAYETKTVYQKTQLAAAAIDLPYTTDMVEDAVKDFMSSKGWKGSGQKGFTVYRGARLGDTDQALNDIYLKVDRRNGDKNSSTLTVFAVKPSEDPATRAADAVMPMDQVKDWLNHLVPSVEAYELEARIGGQQDLAKRSQKKYNNLQDDQADLEKKIRNARSDLEQNKKEQVEQAALVQANVNGDQELMKKAQKRMNKLISDQNSLEKKINKYTSELAQNKNDQASQQTEAQRQQQLLDTLRSQRKPKVNQ
ncbi:MAG: hypothetical protein Q8932_09395 [Bacteroidota bacterium]|nr:hypothetical protein [Bacteroidota bacterium]